VERRSGKHSPRLDEALEHESQPITQGDQHGARVEEFRETEEPTLEEAGVLDDPVLARRELSRHLNPHVFPASREALLRNARENQASEQTLKLLEALPPGRSFETVHEVWNALGELGLHEPSTELEFETQADGRRPAPG
jgi:hypothetical protein